ncbi:BLUF domain-containing protein [Dyadobacter sediminis]|uniref:BLUF domain-containing protein n=1 Tax=Dyadobacter sediminis TaxID=1493691 RepID=A0A5R9KKG8_9BACT|nr:BLUF domain-containing protein [Dyadobacter sediminis]TLU96609.1 BLUF domain-containing protein [Dyadobacter sediminis]GGB83706.1 hypothetical protein GCM10011325_09080 [Dyadobacter sediminis]
MDYCIVYLSSSTDLLSQEELLTILQKSRTKNASDNITGVLLYFNGSIIQVLEGDEEKVRSLYNVISRDRRHTQVIPLYMQNIPRRSFEKWSMGYSTMTAREFSHIKEIEPIVKNPYAGDLQNQNVVIDLIKTFYRNNYRN